MLALVHTCTSFHFVLIQNFLTSRCQPNESMLERERGKWYWFKSNKLFFWLVRKEWKNAPPKWKPWTDISSLWIFYIFFILSVRCHFTLQSSTCSVGNCNLCTQERKYLHIKMVVPFTMYYNNTQFVSVPCIIYYCTIKHQLNSERKHSHA